MNGMIERKFIVNSAGEPEQVIISWADYVEIAEALGWDLSGDEQSQLAEAMKDSLAGNGEAFIAIEELE